MVRILYKCPLVTLFTFLYAVIVHMYILMSTYGDVRTATPQPSAQPPALSFERASIAKSRWHRALQIGTPGSIRLEKSRAAELF